MARTRGFDDGGFAPLTPRAPGMMIASQAEFIADWKDQELAFDHQKIIRDARGCDTAR